MQQRQYTSLYRIIHWLMAITFTLLLITIFLRLTWLNKYNVAQIIQDYLTETGQTLSQDQLIILAKKIRQPMWDWHIYLGYFITGLFCLRMALPLWGKMKIQNPLNTQLTAKQKLQRYIYIIFYTCVAISLITGLLIKFGPKEFKKPIEQIHELSIYYLVAYIILHIGGVLIAEFTDQKGIISRIINGGRK